MAKVKKFIPGSVVASVLAIPAVAFADNNGSHTSAQVRVELVQPRQASYHDRTSAATPYSMNFQAALARAEAQRQAFESYGGANSSSAARPATHMASD